MKRHSTTKYILLNSKRISNSIYILIAIDSSHSTSVKVHIFATFCFFVTYTSHIMQVASNSPAFLSENQRNLIFNSYKESQLPFQNNISNFCIRLDSSDISVYINITKST